MPFKKNYRKKRSFRKHRKYHKAKLYSVPKNKQVHYHVRRINTLSESDFSIDCNNASSNIYRGLAFRLSDLQDYTELTQLYDRYTITKVVLEWIWTLTGTDAGVVGPNASMAPYVNLVRDYDDDDTPTSDYFRSSGRNIRRRLVANRTCKIALSPAVSRATYNTVASTGYGPAWKVPIDCANDSVPHFGLKVQLIKVPLRLGYVQCTAKYYVSCYQTR